MTRNDDCIFCGYDTKGSGITAGNGRLSCHLCWHQRQPFKPRETFRQVLNNGDDRVLVMALLRKYVPENIQQAIVEEFNSELSQRFCRNLNAQLKEREAKTGGENK